MRSVRLLAAIALLVGSATTASAAVTDRVTRTVGLRAGEPIRIDATIADLTITGSNRPDVEIEIVRRAPSSADLAKYPALIETGADGLHISAVHAEGRPHAPPKSQISIPPPGHPAVSSRPGC